MPGLSRNLIFSFFLTHYSGPVVRIFSSIMGTWTCLVTDLPIYTSTRCGSFFQVARTYWFLGGLRTCHRDPLGD